MQKFNINELKEYTTKNKLPFILHWNLTDACNLNCTHCCVPKKATFVPLETALMTIEFLKEKGFFLITLSGGECLLHPNFKEIYLALKKAGMYISIFTNGTTLTKDLKELLATYKPRKVEVSIYGWDNTSFCNATQSTGGYEKFLDTLDFLETNQIRTIVKTPLSTRNGEHLQEYIDLANKYNASYKFGTFLFPMINGDKKPLEERLPYKQAVSIEFSDSMALEGFCARAKNKGHIAEHFSSKCSACTNSYTLNADNSFSFCGMMVEPKFHFHDRDSLEKAFNDVTNYRQSVIEMYENGPCASCEKANVCPGCPAHLWLETGRTDVCNEYFKNITEEKLKYANLDIMKY